MMKIGKRMEHKPRAEMNAPTKRKGDLRKWKKTNVATTDNTKHTICRAKCNENAQEVSPHHRRSDIPGVICNIAGDNESAQHSEVDRDDSSRHKHAARTE